MTPLGPDWDAFDSSPTTDRREAAKARVIEAARDVDALCILRYRKALHEALVALDAVGTAREAGGPRAAGENAMTRYIKVPIEADDKFCGKRCAYLTGWAASRCEAFVVLHAGLWCNVRLASDDEGNLLRCQQCLDAEVKP